MAAQLKGLFERRPLLYRREYACPSAWSLFSSLLKGPLLLPKKYNLFFIRRNKYVQTR